MKEVKHYICDICHTEYNDKYQCQQCEKSHKKSMRIIREHYISQTQNKKGYPHKIDVEFEDGSVLTYKRWTRMSDDLISRKVLLDELNGLRIELNGISCRKEFKKTVKEVLDCVKHIVEDQPTAFDKEKVIEEFRKHSNNFYPSIDHYCLSQNAINLKDAFKIVEKGGIE